MGLSHRTAKIISNQNLKKEEFIIGNLRLCFQLSFLISPVVDYFPSGDIKGCYALFPKTLLKLVFIALSHSEV